MSVDEEKFNRIHMSLDEIIEMDKRKEVEQQMKEESLMQDVSVAPPQSMPATSTPIITMRTPPSPGRHNFKNVAPWGRFRNHQNNHRQNFHKKSNGVRKRSGRNPFRTRNVNLNDQVMGCLNDEELCNYLRMRSVGYTTASSLHLSGMEPNFGAGQGPPGPVPRAPMIWDDSCWDWQINHDQRNLHQRGAALRRSSSLNNLNSQRSESPHRSRKHADLSICFDNTDGRRLQRHSGSLTELNSLIPPGAPPPYQQHQEQQMYHPPHKVQRLNSSVGFNDVSIPFTPQYNAQYSYYRKKFRPILNWGIQQAISEIQKYAKLEGRVNNSPMNRHQTETWYVSPHFTQRTINTRFAGYATTV